MGPSGPEGHRGPSGQPVRILKHCAVKKISSTVCTELQLEFMFALFLG